MTKARIRMEQMDYPTEEQLIREKLMGHPRISHLEFNLLQCTLIVSHDNALPDIISAIQSLGFTAELVDDATSNARTPAPRKPWWPLAISGLAAVSAEIIHFSQLAHG